MVAEFEEFAGSDLIEISLVIKVRIQVGARSKRYSSTGEPLGWRDWCRVLNHCCRKQEIYIQS